MIDAKDCFKQDNFYFYKGKMWKLKSYCPGPSVIMIAIGSGEELNKEETE